MRIRFNKYHLAVLVLFLLAFYLRVTIDGLYPDNPGTVKSSDAAYHAESVEWIVRDGKIGTFPAHLAQGYKDILNGIPPLPSTMAAALTSLTGIPGWNTFYFLVALFEALTIPLMFVIAHRLFNSEKIALLSAGALLIPLRSSMWFYFLAIGIWPQSMIFATLLFFCFVCMLVWNEHHTTNLFLWSVAGTGIYGIHMSESTLVVPLVLGITGFLLYRAYKFPEERARLLVLPIVPLAFLLTTWAGLLGTKSGPLVWSPFNGDVIPQYIPQWANIPIFYMIIGVLGFLLLLYSWKKHLLLIGSFVWSFIILFGIPLLFKGSYYVSFRPRVILLFMIVLLGAYLVVSLLHSLAPQGSSYLVMLLLICALTGFAWSEYSAFKNQMQYQNIPLIRYQGYQWVDQNLPADARIYYIGGSEQSEDVFMRRVVYRVDKSKMADVLNQHNLSQGAPLVWPGELLGNWGWWGNMPYKTGMFSTSNYDVIKGNMSVTEFDYFYIENLQPLQQFASAYAQYLVGAENFSVAYAGDFAVVLKNDRQ